MKTSMVIFAGAIFASSMVAAGNGAHGAMNSMACAKHNCCRPANQKAALTADPGAEARFQMKFGHNTQAEEARQKADLEVYAKNVRQCNEHGCGRNTDGKTVTAAAPAVATADPGAEERFRMKSGRNTPAEEQRLARASKKAEPVVMASADRSMCEAGCCTH